MGIAWSKSGDVQLDNNALPADGALAYFFEGGTTTPLTVFEDGAEATPHEHPLEADGDGRWPLVFIPFITSYDVQVRTEGGTQLYYHQNLPNPNPVEASEAPGTISEEDLIQTGMIHWELIQGTKNGYVRLNGRTMGNSSSGGTERANDDTEDLFVYLYNALGNTQAPVSGGRGASAVADYDANKTITIPSMQGKLPYGLDDMGGVAAALFAGAPFVQGNATTPGSDVGSQTTILVVANLPPHDHTFSATTASDGAHSHSVSGTAASDGAHVHSISDPGHIHSASTTAVVDSGTQADPGSGRLTVGGFGSVTINTGFTGISIISGGAHTHSVSGTAASGGAHTHGVSGSTGPGIGNSTPFNIVSRGLLGTFYIKL